jgi:hypothetical protein
LEVNRDTSHYLGSGLQNSVQRFQNNILNPDNFVGETPQMAAQPPLAVAKLNSHFHLFSLFSYCLFLFLFLFVVNYLLYIFIIIFKFMFCFILLLFYFIFFVLSFHFVDFAGSNQDFAGHHLQPPMTHTPPPSFTAAIHQLVQFISSPKKPHHFTTIPQSHPPLPKPPRAVPPNLQPNPPILIPNQKPETQINPPTSITKSTTIPNLPQPWPLPSHSTKTPHRKLHTSQPHLILSSIQHTKPASSPLHPKTIVTTSFRPNHLTQITCKTNPNQATSHSILKP